MKSSKGPWLCPLCQSSLWYDATYSEVSCTDKSCKYFTSLKDYENNFHRLSMSHETSVREALDMVRGFEDKLNSIEWSNEDNSRDLRTLEVEDNKLRKMVTELQQRCTALEEFKARTEKRYKECGFELESDDGDIQT